jgi:hypothetical protein
LGAQTRKSVPPACCENSAPKGILRENEWLAVRRIFDNGILSVYRNIEIRRTEKDTLVVQPTNIRWPKECLFQRHVKADNRREDCPLGFLPTASENLSDSSTAAMSLLTEHRYVCE